MTLFDGLMPAEQWVLRKFGFAHPDLEAADEAFREQRREEDIASGQRQDGQVRHAATDWARGRW